MSDLKEVGQRDNWICWLCDTAVDPDASVNSDRGPSVDSYSVAKSKKNVVTVERLAHRDCNTMKGNKAPVVLWVLNFLSLTHLHLWPQWIGMNVEAVVKSLHDAPVLKLRNKHLRDSLVVSPATHQIWL